MAYGYRGKYIRVDLARRRAEIAEVSSPRVRDYMGGRGINARFLWDEIKPRAHPLSPENPLLMWTGPLGGTVAPASSRFTVSAKSPETHLYCKSTSGGHVAPELKFAGYDGIVITGASEDPVYLSIHDEKVEIKDSECPCSLHVRFAYH